MGNGYGLVLWVVFGFYDETRPNADGMAHYLLDLERDCPDDGDAGSHLPISIASDLSERASQLGRQLSISIG